MEQTEGIPRRHFLRSAAAAMAVPYYVPASALGLDGTSAPSDRINVGAIGLGVRGRQVLPDFMNQSDVHCLAVADCFASRREAGKRMVDHRYNNMDCVAYRHHEELLARDDIDAVIIATGDRWHAVLSVIAAKAGKDIYCEKPFSLTVGEGRAMVEAMKTYKAVWQCGTQRRSNNSYRFTAEAVRSGKIGKLHTATASLGTGFTRNALEQVTDAPPAETFDYDRWTGQAPLAPFSYARVGLWRQLWATGGGLICDMGPHYFDTIQWAHDSEMDAPRTFEGRAVMPRKGWIAQTPVEFRVEARYEDGVKLIARKGAEGILFQGNEGWIHITDGGALSANPQSILADRKIEEQGWAFMDDHIQNFLECIRSRELTVSHPELTQRTHTLCHCFNICLRVGRKVGWDPTTERFEGDEEANAMLNRPMRAPWTI